ncbi:hypothetical protein [Sciscionella marina]|uniref:hypothetical protein n=1 Tax=Sciscionella marina TaxID=508770 RepID=UPI0012F657D2
MSSSDVSAYRESRVVERHPHATPALSRRPFPAASSAFRLLENREIELTLIVLFDIENLVVQELRRFRFEEYLGFPGTEHLIVLLRHIRDRNRELRFRSLLLLYREPQPTSLLLTILCGQSVDGVRGGVRDGEHFRSFLSVAVVLPANPTIRIDRSGQPHPRIGSGRLAA